MQITTETRFLLGWWTDEHGQGDERPGLPFIPMTDSVPSVMIDSHPSMNGFLLASLDFLMAMSEDGRGTMGGVAVRDRKYLRGDTHGT